MSRDESPKLTKYFKLPTTKGKSTMKLFELKNVLEFDFDISDNEVCGRTYFCFDGIIERYAKQIEVVQITHDLVECKITEFLRHHKTAIRKYLKANYYSGNQLDWLISTLCGDDILCDGGEAVAYFINCDLCDFLTEVQP